MRRRCAFIIESGRPDTWALSVINVGVGRDKSGRPDTRLPSVQGHARNCEKVCKTGLYGPKALQGLAQISKHLHYVGATHERRVFVYRLAIGQDAAVVDVNEDRVYLVRWSGQVWQTRLAAHAYICA